MLHATRPPRRRESSSWPQLTQSASSLPDATAAGDDPRPILAPIHDDTVKRGITLEQVDDTIQRARDAYRKRRRGANGAAAQ
jgi:hypothetical protein